MPLERLHKVLAHAGFGSRRKCEELIAQGAVQVDGRTVTEMGLKVDPEKQRIKCRDQYVRMPHRVVLVMNKPKGVVSTTSDDQGRRTVLDLLRGVRERVYPAGRLDADSQGMMILTNDGALTERLTHPRHRIPKTYHVVVRGEVPDEVLAKAKRGVWLSEGRTGHDRVKVL
jgi:16S rRNA U516 pseudouridylate synthase RsuA-like enzyme